MPKAHSLLELSQSIESVINRTFNSTYWVSAEISKLNFYPKSGHCYPELVEKLNGKIVAEIRSTIWSRTYQNLAHKFQKETGETLREGMKILFAIQVKYSPTHGISLNIQDIDPSFTLGEIAKEKKKTIETLRNNNLFDANRALPFPYFPSRIAIISVISSKGYQDFLETMKFKASHINYAQELFPAILQGDVAVKSITEQLSIIKDRASEFDVVLILRGGGGDVGLNCYNHIKMTTAVAQFPLPVVTGIGHSTNETVVEMVSHTNKITPTAVADTLVEIYRELELRLAESLEFLSSVPQNKIKPQKQLLLNWLHGLKSFASTPITQEKIQLNHLQSSLVNSSKRNLEKQEQLIRMDLVRKLKFLSENQLKVSQNTIELLDAKLRILDPKNILKRGFSLSTINGKVVTNTHQIKKGDSIITRLFDGELESQITKITNE